jgi:hypothetical protein
LVYPSPGGSFYTALSLGSTTAVPFLGLRGPQLELTATASSQGHPSTTASTTVTALPQLRLSGDAAGTVARVSPTALALAATNVGLLRTDNAVENHSAAGRLRIAVRLPAGGPTAELDAPTASTTNPDWQVVDGSFHESNAWVFQFVTTQRGHTSHRDLLAERGPAGFAFDGTVSGGSPLPTGSATYFFSSDETDLGWSSEASKVRPGSMNTPIP